MARISRIRGPAVNLVLTTLFQTVPGFEVNRSFGNGALLISGQLFFGEFGFVAGVITYGVFVDSLFLPVGGLAPNISALGQVVGPFSFLQPISAGFHSVSVGALKSPSTTVSVIGDRSEFIVIELPDWDDDSFVVTL